MLIITVLTIVSIIWVYRSFLISKLSGIMTIPGVCCFFLVWVSIFFGDAIIADIDPTSPGGQVWHTANMRAGEYYFSLVGVSLVGGVRLAGATRMYKDKVANLGLSRVKRPNLVAMASLVVALIFVFAYGLNNLLERATYFNEYAVPSLATFAAFLLPSAFILAVVSFFSTVGPMRMFSLSLMVIYWMIQFATASRFLAVFPLLFIAGLWMFHKRPNLWVILSGVLLSFLGSSLALNMRSSLSGHGFLPYFNQLSDLRNLASLDSVVESVNNILFAIPLTDIVVSSGIFDWKAFWVSVNPALGESAGWTTLSRDLRVSDFIPFNGIGQLATISSLLLIFFMLGLSFFCAISVAKWNLLGRANITMIIVCLYYLFFILMLQYNLRSAMRIGYIIMIISAVGFLIKHSNRAANLPRLRF